MDIASTQANSEMAVLFADVAGSTRLYELLGDKTAFSAISACLDSLKKMTEAHTGRVVKTIGDEIMAVFPDATSAVLAACEMQLQTASRAPINNAQVEIRIGLHFGPVLENTSDGDVHGDTVNVAARMAEIAKSRQIITTGATVKRLPPVMRAATRNFNALPIKGKSDEIEVREVIWQESDEMTMMVNNTLTQPGDEQHLRLVHQGKVYLVDSRRPAITIGRDEQADIVVEDKRASRLHAKIEVRRDKFVFVDFSSNGSFVIIKGETEIPLRREELVLRSSGSISLGHPYKKDPTEVIEFYCGE